VLTIYGLSAGAATRIADPGDLVRSFAWPPEAQYDPRDNAIQYEYIAENRDGVDPSLAYERSRIAAGNVLPQRYLKRIRYGNTRPLQVGAPAPGNNRWSVEVVIDYGDHNNAVLATPLPSRQWLLRPDAFSAVGSVFEVRTWP